MTEKLYDQYIDDLINGALSSNEDKLNGELLTLIPSTYTYLNSVNIAVGRQFSGKTLTLMKEIIKISLIHPQTHLLLYINKTGQETDQTFESLKHLIKCPIIYASHEDAENTLKQIIAYKQLYQTIYDQNLSEKIIDEQAEEIKNVLKIDNFDQPFLHTLVLMDDMAKAKLLSKKDSYFEQMMTQCRHIKCSFFLAVQYWKALSPNIKSNVSTIYIFGGFSRQQLSYILYQINLSIPFPQLWSEYSKLTDIHEKIIVDANNGLLIH